jgi:hypothetical protein
LNECDAEPALIEKVTRSEPYVSAAPQYNAQKALMTVSAGRKCLCVNRHHGNVGYPDAGEGKKHIVIETMK